MRKNEIYQRIQRSSQKKEIEFALSVLFGQSDVRKITDPNLDLFLKRVLPKIEGGAHEK